MRAKFFEQRLKRYFNQKESLHDDVIRWKRRRRFAVTHIKTILDFVT